MDVDKCPYCFRKSGTWQKDPIKLPNGCPYIWTSETELTTEANIEKRTNKGFDSICEPEVQEIQDFLKQTEIANLESSNYTTFSPLNTSGKFQITGKHIKEMRDSVEKLLLKFGIDKETYFNRDEESNVITQSGGTKLEWTDPITNSTDLQKFQVKYIHIEDLRHYISLGWEETWQKARIDPESPYPSQLSDTRSVDGVTKLSDYAPYPPTYDVCADHRWHKLWWEDGSTEHHIRLAVIGGGPSYNGGVGTSKWEVKPTGACYNLNFAIYSTGLDRFGVVSADRVLNININQGTGMQCNKDLRFEMDEFTNKGTIHTGDNVIIHAEWDYYGHHHITEDELNAAKAAITLGGQTHIEISTNHYYATFVYTFGQHITPTPHQVIWEGSGVNLYDAFLPVNSGLTPELWLNEKVLEISISYPVQLLQTIWNGFYGNGGGANVMGYTTNVQANLESTIGAMRLITRVS